MIRTLLLSCFAVLHLSAQETIPRDTSYTIHSNFVKQAKYFPFVTPIEEQWFPEVAEFRSQVYKQINGRKLTLDVFAPTPSTGSLSPGLLLIHGGGWSSGSKAHMVPLAQELAARGYVAVAVEYRLSPEAVFPAGVEDLRESVRWMRAHAAEYGMDPNKIAVLGCSAGAQLASLLGTLNGKTNFEGPTAFPGLSADVQAVLNIDGIVSFVHAEASAEGKASATWLGGTREEAWETWKAASPMEYTDAATPPFLFVNSSHPRFHAGRDDFIRQLNQFGTYSRVHTIEGSPHGFWLLHPWFAVTLRQVQDFMETIFGPAGLDPVAGRMLLWQTPEGGWPKSYFTPDRKEIKIDYQQPLSRELLAELEAGTIRKIPTYDNYATSKEIRYLVRAFGKTGNRTYLLAAERGIQYILDGQYPDSGGWPQFFPLREGYYSHITYNDNAIVNNLNILFDIVHGKNGFDAVRPELVAPAKAALEKGIDCILNTQIRKDGELMVWCAQHDRFTLEPAQARSFELASYSGMESAGIVRFLMRLPDPSEKIQIAIRQALRWFESTKIMGYSYQLITTPDGARDRFLLPDPGAVSWGRFYDLETNLPFVCGRNGVKKATVGEIERERRIGYGWYGDWAKDLVSPRAKLSTYSEGERP
ncbi:MAG: pectate lyase [Saprospiraceae bacterium]|nr:pectate lyase [Saprospiraceae bacterium]